MLEENVIDEGSVLKIIVTKYKNKSNAKIFRDWIWYNLSVNVRKCGEMPQNVSFFVSYRNVQPVRIYTFGKILNIIPTFFFNLSHAG